MAKVRVNWHNGGDLLPASDMPMPILNLLSEGDRIAAQLTKSNLLAEQGRELWSELHTSVTIETLAAWEEKIPNFACKCKAFYTAWKTDHPPRKDDFFAWTVELHNAVNIKLEKPTVSLDDARRIWMV